MYEFKLLDSYYDVEISLEYPDYRHVFYNCKEHLVVRYNKEKCVYNFRLDERKDILLNKKEATEVMDKLMIEVGNLLYPIDLIVSTKGEILEVKNFEEVKKRWYPNAQEILDNNRTHHFKRYLQIASRNLKTEEKLREAITRNSFVKLMVKPLDTPSFILSFSNFPSKGGVSMFNCKRKRGYKDSGIVTEYEAKLLFPSECEGDGYIKYTLSEMKDILAVEARFDLNDENGQKWVKRITIKADQQERTALHKQSNWKRMF